MPELRIAGNLKEELSACLPVLSENLPSDCLLVLGGGTVLASRWEHRISTDLNFFVYGEDLAVGSYISETSSQINIRLANVSKINAHLRHFTFGYRETEVSVFSSVRRTDTDIEDREVFTGVLLEPTVEILAKKLVGRVIGLGEFLPRDLYDFCTASRLDSDSFQSSLKVVSEGEIESISTELGGLQHAPPKNQTDILNPKYKRLAENIWLYTHKLFETRALPSYVFQIADHNQGLSR
ncbi:MAG: nucleotidyl transferase AbiEii/AbiGii toxin family protein [Gammaproteobacteria bacterium]|nr:nucleotidyl transferase AbiEii/AbiGii toxin family protein [Gammaproteobacteria bacterium]